MRLSGAAEAARTAFAFRELIDHIEGDLEHRHDDELRKTVERLQREQLRAAIPCRNEDLALVVGVDEADQVPEHDAVLVAKARARQDHGREPRIGKVDREACGHEVGLAGLKDQRGLDAGAQVEPAAAPGVA